MRLTLRLTDSEERRLAALAAQHGETRQQALRRLIETADDVDVWSNALDNMVSDAEARRTAGYSRLT